MAAACPLRIYPIIIAIPPQRQATHNISYSFYFLNSFWPFRLVRDISVRLHWCAAVSCCSEWCFVIMVSLLYGRRRLRAFFTWLRATPHRAQCVPANQATPYFSGLLIRCWALFCGVKVVSLVYSLGVEFPITTPASCRWLMARLVSCFSNNPSLSLLVTALIQGSVLCPSARFYYYYLFVIILLVHCTLF